MVSGIREWTTDQPVDGPGSEWKYTEDKNTIPKKSPKHKKNNVFVYPSARDIREYEDSLMIKCIDYMSEEDSYGGLGIRIESKSNPDGKVWLNGPAPGDIAKAEWPMTTQDGKVYNSKEEYVNAVQKSGMSLYDPNDITIKPKNESRTDLIEKQGKKLKINYYVELPIPQQIVDTQSVTWGDETINIFELAGLAVGRGLISMGGGINQDKIRKGINMIRNMTGSLDLGLQEKNVQDAVVAAASGMAVNALGSNLDVNSVLSRSTGQILNSNLELLFRGVNLRTFPFDVTFSPRTPDEAKVVKNIIRNFKQSMSARKNAQYDDPTGGASKGKYLLAAPSLFLLRYLKNGEDHPFLNCFKRCALTSLNVNYTGSGTYSTYGDSTPTNIQMRMVFKEINPIYAEDYDNEDKAGPGVGF